ncbi:PAS domain S-box protein [Hymenobacter sp. GOD-10R]|uniref:PAS domain-containing sensor histidine kinase n=1 Tax=Hymenobacter sp. GOD-10R TaxID=3093922 RepID=UPI002D7759BE|nr:PAS domain S-box protein [Hymenobacter sp. GOD-10R]WRQ30577.1 PAS domain S-box protein [Hymenobacter sp. GOD-10R]
MAESDDNERQAHRRNADKALALLRQRAERRRELVTQAAAHRTPDDVMHLVQELQTHQIELEMQYEELLQAQLEAQTARIQYEDLYEFAPIGYLTLTDTGVIQQLNLAATQQLNSMRKRVQGQRFMSFVSVAFHSHFLQFWEDVRQSDHRQTCELELQPRGGRPLFVRLEGVTLNAPTSQVPVCRIAIIDISERHAASQALAASEAKFRMLFEQTTDAIVLLQNNYFIDCNPAALKLLGASHKSALVGTQPGQHAPKYQPDGQLTQDLFNSSVQQALEQGSMRCEALMYTLSGEEIWMEAVLTPIRLEGQPLVHIVWRDINEYKQYTERLRESEAQLSAALRAGGLGVMSWTPDTDVLELDERARVLLQAPPTEQLTFDVIRSVVHPEDLAWVSKKLGDILASHSAFDFQHRLLLADNSVRYIAISGQVERTASGNAARLIGLLHDVTQLEQQKEQLRAEKEFTQGLLDNSVDGILAFDQQRRLTAWNQVMVQQTGLLEADLLGRDVFDVFPHYWNSSQGEAIREVLAGRSITRYNLSFYERPGYFESYLVPLLDAEEKVSGGLVLIRDVTERVRLAAEATNLQLRQQQEVLSAILTTQEEERKRIAEALHNGVGQLLYATKLNLENLSEKKPNQRAVIMTLLDEAIRATRTISFELTPGILEDFGLKIGLQELSKRIPKQNLHIHMQLHGLEQPRPRLLDVAIYRIVQELLNNVIKHAEAQEVYVHVVHEEGRASISVEDDGVGFNSSADAGSLKGIGLAGIRQRVDLLGGTLTVDSRPGRGTIVSIELAVRNFTSGFAPSEDAGEQDAE